MNWILRHFDSVSQKIKLWQKGFELELGNEKNEVTRKQVRLREFGRQCSENVASLSETPEPECGRSTGGRQLSGPIRRYSRENVE